jgi:hypothetical protein
MEPPQKMLSQEGFVNPTLLTRLLMRGSSKIVFIILGGLGGIQVEEKGPARQTNRLSRGGRG